MEARFGSAFLRVHCTAHGIVVLSHKAKVGLLQEQQRKVVVWELGNKARQIRDIKCYVDRLEEMIAIIEEHQRVFSCSCEYGFIARVSFVLTV